MPVSIPINDATAFCELFDGAAESLRSSPHRVGSAVNLPARGRLLLTGDLHDNPEHFEKIVRLADLGSSRDHHVVLHEIIHGEMLVNGVDLSHRMLARAARLAADHPGQVHILMANHELAQMTGQRVTKGAGDNVALFNDGLEFAFGDAWEEVAQAIGRFIGAMPLACRSESGLFCAHSLPSPRRLPDFDPSILDRELVETDYRPPDGSAYLMVWGRGWSDREVQTLAGHWGTKLFCLGHEHVENGIAMRGGQAIILNSDHEMGTVVPIDLSAPPTAEEAMFLAVRLGGLPPAGTMQ